MDIDVIVPATRPGLIDRLLYSLSRNTVRPDVVTVVSNEVGAGIATYGLKVRIVGFSSTAYPFGIRDVALRRNVGIFASSCSHVLTFDDDQVAPADLIAWSRKLLDQRPYFWGHHRFIDFGRYSVDELLELEPEKGRSREMPPNAYHFWMSCYGGLSGARRDLLETLGGYDLAFLGRHAGEDQDLGKRMARLVDDSDKVFIHEPPFAWHPEEKNPWSPPARTNLCESHDLVEVGFNGSRGQQCRKCPYFVAPEDSLLTGRLMMRFDPAKVDVTVQELTHGTHSAVAGRPADGARN